MTNTSRLKAQISSGDYDGAFARLYPRAKTEACRKRYIDAVTSFENLFGPRDVILVSAPGRTEICGNHTDHQHGIVLAAAVDLDILCVASPNNDHIIRLQSKGYARDNVSLSDLSPHAAEREKAPSLIRGVAAWLMERGVKIGGFDAYTTSDVLGGSGLSSSAAFEVAVGNTLAALYGGDVTPQELAIAGQYAENNYFGKPSGLMDQMASSVGGFIQIDFADPKSPDIRQVSYDLAAGGLNLCIVDTKGSHGDLTEDYAAIPREMKAVAALFGCEYLRKVDEARFLSEFSRVRREAGDRAALRAMHFFTENALVPKVREALEAGDTKSFLSMITASGLSSFTTLQNVLPGRDGAHQGLAVALAWSGRLLADKGAWRVHGGGFAGTIQAFVPDKLLSDYRETIDSVFGAGACGVLSVRPYGGCVVTPDLKEKH